MKLINKVNNHCYKIIIILIITFLLLSCSRKSSPKPVDIMENWDGFYVYHPFSWPTSTPLEQGMDADILADGVNQALQTDYMYSLLIVRNGYLILEEYFNETRPNFAGTIHSATKSFTSALLGIALHQNYINSLDQKFVDFFPEYQHLSPYYEDKSQITLHHLLTMRAGFPDDTRDEIIRQLSNSDDWIEFAFQLPLEAAPGERWAYSSISSHLLAAVITKATGMSLFDFAQQNLFSPPGIPVPHWGQDPTGYYIGSASLFLTPRDMARFGYLYLNNGAIDGQQIIPEEWVEQTTQSYSSCPWPSGEFQDLEYAYHWWTASFAGYDFFMAQGKGGQNIVIVPDLKMVVVTTTKADMSARESWTQSQETFNFIAEYVLSAVIKENIERTSRVYRGTL